MRSDSAKIAYGKEAVTILEPYKVRFEKELEKACLRFGPENQVKEAMVYALKSQGKRFRPALVYMMADGIEKGCDVSSSALAVEYFHTSSLIADDLPCMDNDDFRRGIPTTHKVYGEATALLASYALIAQGFEEIAKNADNADQESPLCQIAILEASKQMGNMGLIGGQCLDLLPFGLERQDLLQIMEMKTVSLFDLSLTLGWLFGGGKKEELSLVHKMALHFGLAFQILDDLDDREKDLAANRPINFANRFGTNEAVLAVENHAKEVFSCMEKLRLVSPPFSRLTQGLILFSSSFKE